MINIETELNLATNLFGNIKEEYKDGLRDYMLNPIAENWDKIFSIIINEDSFMTVWEAVIATNKDFPKKAGTECDPLSGKWPVIPTRKMLYKALFYATH